MAGSCSRRGLKGATLKTWSWKLHSDAAEALVEDAKLDGFAAVESNTLRIFPEAHKAEPEVGLEALPGNIQRHQRPTDFDREPSTDTGVEQCCPDQIPRYVCCSPLAEWDFRRSGEPPEYDQKRNQRDG
jgi:hypothetical protein